MTTPLDTNAIVASLRFASEKDPGNEILKSWQVTCLDVVESTNELAKAGVRSEADSGLVYVAARQEGGYGRQGRSWSSPLGSLYFSFALDAGSNLQQLPSLSPLIVLGVYQAVGDVAESCPLSEIPTIKWPNDLVCSAGKLCGISTELVGDKVVVGIGLNVFHPYHEVSVGGKYVPAYLCDLFGSEAGAGFAGKRAGEDGLSAVQRELLQMLLVRSLVRLSQVYAIWQKQGFAPFRTVYEAGSKMVGSRVAMENIVDAVTLSGVVEGFDAQAHLLLRDDQGSVHAVGSGEVHLL